MQGCKCKEIEVDEHVCTGEDRLQELKIEEKGKESM